MLLHMMLRLYVHLLLRDMVLVLDMVLNLRHVVLLHLMLLTLHLMLLYLHLVLLHLSLVLLMYHASVGLMAHDLRVSSGSAEGGPV